MFNLYSLLTPLDNKRIENYINRFATKNYIGNEKYLEEWGKNNIKLYKLLGNQLIYKMPITIKKPDEALESDLHSLEGRHDFIDAFEELYFALKEIEPAYSKCRNDWMPLLNTSYLKANKVLRTHNVNFMGKTLKISEGTKLFKALNKIVIFVTNNYNNLEQKDKDELKQFPNLKSLSYLLEDFRICHSIIFNNKILKGNLCLSIHPLDFMTMSDNNNNWSSCMSWKETGCYRTGTVEMMNSNLVICAYLDSEKNFFFNESGTEVSEEYTWNNKKWRQLFYCHKDIIVSGKAYPYSNTDLTMMVLEKLRELAKENWNQTYAYGIEPYRDMIHINTLYKFNRNRMWAKGIDSRKHNIIFDTHAMYNDIFNDKGTTYWCIRNKVKKNLILNLSGKVCCPCCGEYNVVEKIDYDDYSKYLLDDSMPDFDDDDIYDYNSQYAGTKRLVCSGCYTEKNFLTLKKKYDIIYLENEK